MSKHSASESATAILALVLTSFVASAEDGRRFPQVAAPPFWKGRVEEIEAAVAAVKAGKVQVIARSPGGRPVHLIEYGPRNEPKRQANYGSATGADDPRHYAGREERSPPVIFLVGPMHGHEVEGMVGLVNLMHVAETGADLRGKQWPRLAESFRRSRVLIVPISNPDGRARCVYDNFIGIPVDEMTRIGQGTRKDGTLYGWPGVKQRHPMKGDVGLLGAYFNDDGINLMHDEFFAPMAEETKALLRVAREEAPEFLMILHSHGAAPEVLPTAYVPRFQKESAARFGARLVGRYRSGGLPAGRVPEPTEDGAKYPPPSFNLTSALHHVCGGLSMLFECPHGLKETRYPQVTFDQILDLELILFEELLAFALEEPRPVAGKKTAAAVGSEQPPRAPYGAWKNGPPSGADYFPIAVWLQDPRNAVKYKEAGINLYVGLWKGPTEAQLDALRGAGMSVICSQNEVGLAHRSDPTIVGWMHGDEPDNAQPIRNPATGKESYGPPVPTRRIVEDYERIRSADPTRPVLLNLGQGVANDEWIGRGSGASLDDYPGYLKGCDVASFDVYPVAGLPKENPEDYLWYVPKGVDRLVRWTGGEKVVWNCIECTRISGGRKATPRQVRSEVWMSLIHGSRGLIYFVHQFQPKFIEAGLLADPEMLAAVTATNREIRELAPVLNSPTVDDLTVAAPTIAGGAMVKSSDPKVPIDVMVKRHAGATYVFAVGMRNGPARARFEVRGLPARADAEAIGEGRKIPIEAGKFEDDFGPYDVRIYRIR